MFLSRNLLLTKGGIGGNGGSIDAVQRDIETSRDKKPGEKKVHYPTPYRTEIVRVMSTQKAITTEGTNALGE